MAEAKLQMSFQLSILFFLIVELKAETKTYQVENSCVVNGMSFTVSKGDEYELTYSGNSYLALSECVYRFSPSKNDSDQLCIKAHSYTVNNCNFWMDFLGGGITRPYTCQDTPSDYCGPEGSSNALIVKFRNGNSFKNVADDIKLKIAVEEGFNYIILAIVLSSLAGLGIVIFVIVMVCNRKKKSRVDRVSPAPPTSNNTQTQNDRRPVPTQSASTSTDHTTVQYSQPEPSTEPTYEEDGIHKPHPVPPFNGEHSSTLPPPEASRPPLVPSAPSYDSEPPPTYEQAMAKDMDV